MTIQYRGHSVIDQDRHMIGTIDDVLYDAEGSPTWAIVDVGLLRASHFVPIEVGYTADDGAFVVPFDKQTVTSAPKADRSHTIDPATETELRQYYGISRRARRELTTIVAGQLSSSCNRSCRCVNRHGGCGNSSSI